MWRLQRFSASRLRRLPDGAIGFWSWDWMGSRRTLRGQAVHLRFQPRWCKWSLIETTQGKPAHATHWSTRSLAAELGISDSSVLRIWRAHGLKPHLVNTFKVEQ